MSKEEIEAVETLKKMVIQEYDWWINKGDYAESNVKETNDAIKTILNLIEKQENKIANQEKEIKLMKSVNINNNYVSKDEIRRKIEKYENDYDRQYKKQLFNLTRLTAGKISSLQELLGE